MRTLAGLPPLALVAVAVLASCTHAPAGPSDEPETTVPPAPTQPTPLAAPASLDGLARDVALASDVGYSFVASRAGGTYEVPGTGLTVVVPAGAIAGPELRIGVTAHAGGMVAYSFEPHGATFAAPLTLVQDMRATGYHRLRRRDGVQAGYFADAAQLDRTANVATVTELLPVDADLKGNKLRVRVTHFSGYMLASGRVE